MTIEEIITFLTVAETGNISLASNKLFVSQSTVSSRLQSLEKELGVKLLIRQKGHRQIDFTVYGNEFIPIAQQWVALWKDTQNLKNLSTFETLTIGSVDLINNYTFLDLYLKHLDEKTNIKLDIQTYHSCEIHTLLENKSIDIGFVFSQVRYPDIISKPIFREEMYLVCNKDSNYYDNIKPEKLDVENEVFLKWSNEYQLWHDRHWSSSVNSYITVNTGSMLAHYLRKPNNWTIAPLSIINSLQSFDYIVSYKLYDSPPPQICYQLTHRSPKPNKLEIIKEFEKEIYSFLLNNKAITII